MPETLVKGRLLRWGNSLGIRISKRDARRLKLRPGSDVTVRIESEPGEIDLSVLPTFRGRGTEGRDHDKLLGEARRKEMRR
ncbi:MAG TPA: hypothetical protein VGB42_08775 [Candidatus Thermoplasmatota archaeon]